MATTTKIEWCDGLTSSWVHCPMAGFAYCLHVKPMNTIISKMVMIFACWFSAQKTRQASWVSESANFDGIPNHATRSLFNRLRLFSGASRTATALVAYCTEAIPTVFVYCKHFFQFPRSTFPAEFFAICCSHYINIERNAKSCGSNF